MSTAHLSAQTSSVTQGDGGSERQVTVMSAALHHGHLDHPSVLAEYNAISADLLDRVVTLSEKQADHRRDIERRTINSANRRSWGGYVFALLSTCVVMTTAYLIAKLGHPVSAGFIGSLNVVGIIGAVAQSGKSAPVNLDVLPSIRRPE